MLRPSAIPLLSAAALALLSGCTITTYSSSNPRPKKPAQAQPQPTTRRPAVANVHRTTTTTTPTKPTTDVAPRITAPIAFGNGTGGAFIGRAYVIPESTSKMPDFGGMVPFATLYTNSFDIKNQDFAGGFPGALVQEDWFGVRYEGSFALPADGGYQFKVVSDDGAILYVDGQKVVDNDGAHTARPATGRLDLKAGKHALRLDYFQAAKGKVALQVFLVEGNTDRVLVGIK